MLTQTGYLSGPSAAMIRVLVGVFLALLLATFYNRTPNYDDAWFAEQAYWLAHDGRVRSELFRGVNGWEKQLFIFHKGFIYFGTLVQWLFGFSLPAGKSVGAIWTALLGLMLWVYGRQVEDGWALWLLLLLYVANGAVIELAFVNRPEPMYTVLGFGSFCLLTTNRWPGAAALAGLAVFTHLNGLCFVVAGVGWLLSSRQWWRAIGFGLVAGLVSSLYSLDVALSGQWATFWMQLTNEPALAHISGVSDKLIIILNVYRQFFINRTTTAFTMLVLGTLLLNARRLLTNQTHPARPSALYLLWLVIGFALVTRTHTPNYAFIFVPFCAVVVARCIVSVYQCQPVMSRQAAGFYGLLTLYLLAGAAKAVYTIRTNYTTPVLAEQNARMAALIGHPGANVLAPVSFFYNQMSRYHLQAVDAYLFYYQSITGKKLTNAVLFSLAESTNMAAVITYDGKGPTASLSDTRPLPDSLNHIGHYHCVYQDRWNSLYLPDR
ncbi:hypothetical protein [Fibrella aquatilis]|uniref:Uncharacterized protein n=1 Tax=Fibrella aquatilis TaxID=2817059 RepID=A0A939G962_9BACT|nr:hypothetical protein [Fibrella aquatilis]MBO0934534.1 hypothetical protein [Fibrella aquatilis]